LRKAFVTVFTLASLAVLLGLTVILGSAISKEMNLRMTELRSKSIEELESILGHSVTYTSISPSFLNYLEVRGLTIHDNQDPSKTLLAIHRVRIYYSLARLVLRHDPVGSLREIRILNTRFSFDLRKDKAIIELLQKLTVAGTGDSSLHARISGADVDMNLQADGVTLSVTHLFFLLNAENNALAVSFRAECHGVLPSGFDFTSALDVAGKVDRAFTWSDLAVRLLSFDSSLFALEKQTLQVVWKGNQVQVQKIQDRSPIDLGVTADLGQKQLTVSFQTDGLRPDQLVRFSHDMTRFNNWLTAPITAAGHLTYSLSSHSLSYQVGVSVWFQDQLPVHDLTLDSTVTGTEKGASFFPLRISSPKGSLQFDGKISYDDFYPDGALTLVNVDAGTGRRVNADLSIHRRNGGLAVEGRHLLVGEVGFDDFSVALVPEERGTSFTIESSFANTANGHISAHGELLLRKPVRSALAAGDTEIVKFPSITLSASLRDVPPDKLYHLLAGAGTLSKQQEDIRSVLSRYALTANLELTTDLATTTVSSELVQISQVDDPATAVRFSALIDSSRVAINDLSGTWRGYTVTGSFQASFAEEGQIGFSTDLTFLGTPFSFKGRYSNSSGLYASGSYGLEVNIVPNRDGTYSLQAKAGKLPIPVAGSSFSISFDASGLYSGPGEWVLHAPSFTVFNVPLLESKRNTISFTAHITPRRIDLERINFTDAYSALSGSAEVLLVMPPDPFDPSFLTKLSAQLNGTLRGKSGTESYTAQGTLTDGTLGIGVSFEGVPLERMRALSVKGDLSGTGTITGPLAKPSMTFLVSLKDGRLGTDPISAETRATLGPESIQFNSLKLTYLAHSLNGGTGSLDMRKGTFFLSATYAGDYFSDHVQLVARLEGQFALAAAGAPKPNLLDQVLQGRLSLDNITVEGKSFPSWAVSFRAENGRLTLDGGPGNSIHGSLDSHLAFAIHLARPLPFVGDAGGRIIGDHIVASAAVETFDATVLNSVLKTAPITTQAGTFPVLSFISGTASGRLAISGPVNDPDFNGELSVFGAGVRSAYSPDDAGPITTKLIFDGKGFHFPSVLVKAGASRLSAEGSFTIDHWVPAAFDLSLRPEGETGTHFKAKFGRMIADGHLQGTLRIAGDDRSTNVTGNVLVRDCRITLGQASQGTFVPEEPPTFLTLSAETGKRVEFAWPSESYPVFRTTAVPGGKVEITYRGDTGAYTVKGNAGVQGGEIYYFERSFIIRKGTIAFNEDQQNFDPRITARAEAREYDPSTGEEIRVYLDADNPLSKFTPRFSSDPPRSDNYLLAMIGAPLVAQAETQGLGISAALVSSDVVSQAWVLRPLEQRLRDVLGVDMVSVRTQIIQNLLVQKIFGTSLNPLDNTSVSLGKYLGNDLFLEMLLRLQTQPVPGSTGFTVYPSASGVGLPFIPANTLPSPGIGLQPQLEWSMEWTTPFFTLDWIFQPQHPETLFLTDNALSFSWRISY
jgi:hypothetical protein